jgi:hypothetical protein
MGCGASSGPSKAPEPGKGEDVPQPKPGASAASEEKAKPATEGAEVDQGTKGKQSMEMYFQELQKFTKAEMKTLKEIEALNREGKKEEAADKQKDLTTDRTAFGVTSQRLLKEVFDFGDSDSDETLSPEESKKVFEYIVDEKADYISVIMESETRRSVAHQLGLSRRFMEVMKMDEAEMTEELKAEKKLLEMQAAKDSAEVEKSMKEALDNYKAQKHSRDKKAFEVLDTGKDGRISKKEFMAAFDPSSDTYKKFLEALGLYDVQQQVEVKSDQYQEGVA